MRILKRPANGKLEMKRCLFSIPVLVLFCSFGVASLFSSGRNAQVELANMSIFSYPERQTTEPPAPAFPKIIHATTMKPDALNEHEVSPIESCKKMNSDHIYKLYSDEDIRTYVQGNFPEFLELFDSLENQVMRTDMWRYLVMYKEGGLYMDTDVTCVHPTSIWLNYFAEGYARSQKHPSNSTALMAQETSRKIRAMVGIENFEKKLGKVRFNFLQWTMYAMPGHPIFLRTVEKIQRICQRRMFEGKCKTSSRESVIEITGPAVFSAAVREYAKEQQFSIDNEMNDRFSVYVAGDLAILGHDYFGCCWDERFDSVSKQAARHPDMLVAHGFFGRWKGEKFEREQGPGSKDRTTKIRLHS